MANILNLKALDKKKLHPKILLHRAGPHFIM
jgi:hypothetical protein